MYISLEIQAHLSIGVKKTPLWYAYRHLHYGE